MLKRIIHEARNKMPKYFDKDDLYGVRITVNPKHILFGCKKLKNLLSPPISVGKNIKIIIKLEKLKNFNESINKQFWDEKAILEKFPNKNVINIENIVFLENKQIFEKEIESEFTSCEGDVEYRIGFMYALAPTFSFPLYTANVRSTDWRPRDLKLMIIGGVIVAVIIEIIKFIIGH